MNSQVKAKVYAHTTIPRCGVTSNFEIGLRDKGFQKGNCWKDFVRHNGLSAVVSGVFTAVVVHCDLPQEPCSCFLSNTMMSRLL